MKKTSKLKNKVYRHVDKSTDYKMVLFKIEFGMILVLIFGFKV